MDGVGMGQVILVRDVESRERLRKRVGNKGLVLSVHECKGLEFQVGGRGREIRVTPTLLVWGDLTEEPLWGNPYGGTLMGCCCRMCLCITSSRTRLWVTSGASCTTTWPARTCCQVAQRERAAATAAQPLSLAGKDGWMDGYAGVGDGTETCSGM